MASTSATRNQSISPTQKGPNDAVPPKAPVLRVTRYDQVTSFLIAIVAGLLISVVALSTLWVSTRPAATKTMAEIELIESPGGSEDGAPDETLKVDSPDPESPDASLTDAPQDESKVEDAIENVMEISQDASMQAQKQYEIDVTSTGKKGSASGTGRRALGRGTGRAGFPREDRWIVHFADRGTLMEYARQLDYFGIELGALMSDGRLIFLSRMGDARPTTRTVTSGSGESRLYFTWRGGDRRTADMELFKKAGIDIGGALIFHFYPKPTENTLALLERNYRNQPAEKIRRTYFVVRRKGAGYEFEVTRQVLL